MIKMEEKKFSASAYAAFLVVVLILIVVIFSMYKYSVEGESRPPFIISKIIVTSGAKTVDITKKEVEYAATILQNNDIKIAVEKNPEYKNEANIKKLIINNIQISETTNNQIAAYRPSKGTNLYDYQEQYALTGDMEYLGSNMTDLKGDNLKVSNQGGIIELSVAQYNLGEITYKENEQIPVDGTLLKSLNIDNKNVFFKLTFDMIVELEGNLKFKTTITMDLPKGDIIENGIEIYEHTDFKSVFKRI